MDHFWAKKERNKFSQDSADYFALRLFFWPWTERAQKLKEAEERARNRPRIFKEPKSKSVFKSRKCIMLDKNSCSFSAVFVSVPECPPLGMESHKIEGDQLTASSMSQYRFAPQRARLNMQVHKNQLLAALANLWHPLVWESFQAHSK